MKHARVMTTVLLLACLSFITTGTVVSQESVYEGSIAVGTYGRLPANGLYAASNAFPRNSTVRVTDSATGKSVDVLVVEGLSNPNIFLLLSPEAAQRVEMASNEVIRARVVEVPVGDPVTGSPGSESAFNPDPDINPAASVPSGGEKEMIDTFIREELAAMERTDEESLQPVAIAEAEPEPEPEPKPKTKPKPEPEPEPEPEVLVRAEEPEEAEEPGLPSAVALDRGKPDDAEESREGDAGAETPDLPEPPEQAEPGKPELASLAAPARIPVQEQISGREILPEPSVAEAGEAGAAEPAERVMIVSSPERSVALYSPEGWEPLDSPEVPVPVQDPLMAGSAPDGGERRIAVSDVPQVPAYAVDGEERRIVPASSPERQAPGMETGDERFSALTEPEVREAEIPEEPVLVDGPAAQPPEEELVEKDADLPEAVEKPIPGDAELVIEKAGPRPPDVDIEELEPAEAAAAEPEPEPEPPVRTAAAVSIRPYLTRQLDAAAYYLQLAVFSEADAAGRLAQSLSSTYPVTINPKEDGSSFRVMVGPLRKDESGALLVSFRAGGYRDAFVRKGN